MNRILYSLYALAFLSLVACDVSRWQAENNPLATAEANAEATSLDQNGIRLTPITDLPGQPAALLTLKNRASGASAPPGGAVPFAYEVTNFALPKSGTSSVARKAEVSDGQHVRTIIDNQLVYNHSTPVFALPLAAGPHVVLTFLEDDAHVSLKHQGAYVLHSVGMSEGARGTFDASAPHLFHSHPLGVYSGKDAENVVLDFYLVNTSLSEKGNKVRATLNGTEFLLNDWVPYRIEGLAPGENTIKLELIDERGNQIIGPYNAETRTFNLEP